MADSPKPIPEDHDHFTVFDLPRMLSVDPGDLTRRFLGLSREHHPDRFAGAAPDVVAATQRNAARVNDAYRTLKDPISRAEYLLEVSGVGRPEGDAKCPPDLLEAVFDLRERQMEGEDVADRAGELLGEAEQAIEALFVEHDRAGDNDAARDALRRLRQTLDRRKFLVGLVAEVS